MPYLGLDPLEPLGLPALRSAGMPRKRRRSDGTEVEEMTPEEETSLLSGTLGALGWLAESLDKPRAALQGLLAGQPEQLWNLLPFSDTLGVTDEGGYLAPYVNQLEKKNRVYGRDLLEAWDIAPANQEGFHPIDNPQDALWDALGLGVEFIDPLLAVKGPMGALTKAGLDVSKGAKFAKGAEGLTDLVTHAGRAAEGTQKMGRIMGTTPMAVANEIRAGERGLLSLGLPFVKEPWAVFGAGSERAANVVEAINYSRLLPTMPIRALFSKKVAGIWDPAIQKARDHSLSELINLDAMNRVAGEVYKDRLPALESLWKEIGEGTGFSGVDDILRHIAETKNYLDNELIVSEATIRGMFDKTVPEVEEFAKQARPLVDAMMQIKDLGYDKAIEMGLPAQWIESTFVNHFPRGVTKPEYEKGLDKILRQVLPTKFKNAIRRKEFLDQPGGTHTIDLASRDELLTATTRSARVDVENGLRDALNTLDPVDLSSAPEFADLYKIAGDWNGASLSLRKAMLNSNAKDIKDLAWTQLGTQRQNRVLTTMGKPPSLLDLADEALDPYGKMPMEELQGWYYYHKYANPELEKALARGMDPVDVQLARDRLMSGLTQKVKGVKRTAGEAVGEATPLSAPLPSETAVAPGAPPTTPQGTVSVGGRKVAEELAEEQPLIPMLTEYLSQLPDDVLETGLFNRTTFTDWMDYAEHLAVSNANLATIHNFLQNVISKEPKGDDWVSLNQAIQGVVTPKGERLLTDNAITTAVKRFYAKNDPEALARLNQVDPAKLTGSMDELGSPISGAADKLFVDPKTASTIGKYLEVATPEGKNWLSKIWDQQQALFSFGVTLPWPAFQVRNRVDGVWRNFMRVGANTYGLAAITKAEGNLARLRWFGRVPEEGGAGTRRMAIADLPHIREFVDAGVLEGQHAADIAAAVGGSVETMPTTLLEALVEPRPWNKAYWADSDKWDWLNPLNMNKVRAAEKTGKQNVAAEMGKRVHQWVEFANRYAPFTAAMESGMDAAQARKLVLEIQFDYSRLKGGAIPGNFSDTVMRKVFPFWSFMQNNVPYQVQQILNYPGGGHAQTLRFINQMHRANSEYLPEWLSERTAIRLPGDDDNKAKFLRQFGLSIEDLTRFSPHLTGKGIHRTASRFLAEMNPLLTYPYKLYSGQDLYSGRPLKEMKGVTRMPALNTLLQSSPISRGISVGRMFTDESTDPAMKAMNFLTGARVSAVDLEKSRLYDLQAANRNLIESDPVARLLEIPYVPKDKRETASPKTLEAVKRSAALTKRIRELIEKRKGEKVGTD